MFDDRQNEDEDDDHDDDGGGGGGGGGDQTEAVTAGNLTLGRRPLASTTKITRAPACQAKQPMLISRGIKSIKFYCRKPKVLWHLTS